MWRAHLAAVGLLCVGCAALKPGTPATPAAAPPPPPVTDRPFGDPARRDRAAALELDAITETATGKVLTPQQLGERLASARLIFVGESHTDPYAHEAQRHLIELLADAGRKVLIGMEMYPAAAGAPAVQKALDAWVAGRGTEEDLLRGSSWYKHWGHHFGYYRDIFLLARARAIPIFGVNLPRPVVTAVRKKGFDKLTPEEAAYLPPRIDIDSDEHRRMFRSYFGEDDPVHGGMSQETWDALFRAQCTWDAAMAHNAIKALETHGTGKRAGAGKNAGDGAPVMVVLIGSGHVAFDLGAPRQAAHWLRDGVVSVIAVPVVGDDGEKARVRASYADFLWATPPEPNPPPYPLLGATVSDRSEVPHPVVSSVEPQSAAGRAGLKIEDRVLAVDGRPVTDKESFLLLMHGKRWGDGVAIEVERSGKRMVIEAALRRAMN